MNHSTIQPRLIRLRDAPHYLGMNINYFNAEVRRDLTEITIGIQGIAFDRLDLDAWAEHYKLCNGRPVIKQRSSIWDDKKAPDSLNETGSGILTNASSEVAFAKALAQANLPRRKSS